MQRLIVQRVPIRQDYGSLTIQPANLHRHTHYKSRVLFFLRKWEFFQFVYIFPCKVSLGTKSKSLMFGCSREKVKPKVHRTTSYWEKVKPSWDSTMVVSSWSERMLEEDDMIIVGSLETFRFSLHVETSLKTTHFGEAQEAIQRFNLCSLCVIVFGFHRQGQRLRIFCGCYF